MSTKCGIVAEDLKWDVFSLAASTLKKPFDKDNICSKTCNFNFLPDVHGLVVLYCVLVTNIGKSWTGSK